MLVNELRVGNYVTQDGEFIQGISSNGIHKFDIEQISLEPIPLTEQWLLKFGFKKKQTHYTHSINRGYEFILDSDFTLCDIDIFVSVKYVHQLQNLYFALTGKELCL